MALRKTMPTRDPEAAKNSRYATTYNPARGGYYTPRTNNSTSKNGKNQEQNR